MILMMLSELFILADGLLVIYPDMPGRQVVVEQNLDRIVVAMNKCPLRQWIFFG